MFFGNTQLFVYPLIFVYFYLVVNDKTYETANSHYFLLINNRSGFLAGIKWCVCISKLLKNIMNIIQEEGSCLYIYHLVNIVKFNFLVQLSVEPPFPSLSCLVLSTSCTILLHWLYIRLTPSFPSTHNLYVLFSCILLNFCFNMPGIILIIIIIDIKLHLRTLQQRLLPVFQRSLKARKCCVPCMENRKYHFFIKISPSSVLLRKGLNGCM